MVYRKIKNIKKITVEVDVSKPVLDILLESSNVFFNDLLNNMPYTYYVDVTVGNDHLEMTTFPLRKIFRGQGVRIEIPTSLRRGENEV